MSSPVFGSASLAVPCKKKLVLKTRLKDKNMIASLTDRIVKRNQAKPSFSSPDASKKSEHSGSRQGSFLQAQRTGNFKSTQSSFKNSQKSSQHEAEQISPNLKNKCKDVGYITFFPKEVRLSDKDGQV